MKIIIIVSILVSIRAQDLDENFSVANDIISSQFDVNQRSFATLPSNREASSYLELTTFPDNIEVLREEQWFNVNQTYRRDSSSSRAFLSWKPTAGSSRKGANYILSSDPRCVRQMCSVLLKYNGTLSSRTSGCLSFSLRTRGQPVGQLWIIEDKEQDNTSQKVQLTNKTLRIEHSLKPKTKNLSIEARLLFRNPRTDSVLLSNLNVRWKGSCPKYRPTPTPSSDLIGRRATREDDFLTISSESSNTLTTNEDFQSSEDYFISQSTTNRYDRRTATKRPFAFLNQKNVGWVLSLISVSCTLLILSAVGHSLWLIKKHHFLSWHVTFDSQIQFLARRSIHSSTRSETKIATISDIAHDMLNDDLQKEQQANMSTMRSSAGRSTPTSYYTFFLLID